MEEPSTTNRHCMGSQCHFKEETTGRNQIRCIICCIWHHIDCVSVEKGEMKMIWTCPQCRELTPIVRGLSSEIKELKSSQDKMMEMLKIISAKLQSESDMKIKAQEELAGARSQLTELNRQLEIQQTQLNGLAKAPPPDPPQPTPSAPPMPNLLLGTSLLRNVDPKKVKNWDIIAKGGAKIEDLQKEIEGLPEDKEYNEVIIVAGSVDLEEKNEAEIILDYQSLCVSAMLKSSKVMISSILPRSDKDLKSKTNEVNEKLKELCDKDGYNYVDNDPSFFLMNGDVNEANLTADGLHLTKRGIDSLIKNCGVLQNGSVFTPTRYPKSHDENIFFRGHKSPFSNFYEVLINHNGQQFTSTEAAYQYCKAETMGDSYRARKILHAKTGLHAFRIAEKIQTDERWKNKKVKVMEGLVKEKLRACELVRAALLETGSKKIIEDTSHEFWGRGKEGKGQNMLGKIWMKFRQNLRNDPNFPGKSNKTDYQHRNRSWTNSRKPERGNWATRRQQPRCYQCGETGHGELQCRKHQTVSCWSCGLAGHKRKHCEDLNQRSRNHHWNAY